MRLLERYAQAVNSDDLTVNERTTWADTDVLGAAGLAAKYHALGIALVRLFADGKPEQAVRELAEMAFKRARTVKVKQSRVQAEDLAKAVLGWHRHGICHPCGGTGYTVIAGTPVQGDECPQCKGTGRAPFDEQFAGDGQLLLARWLSAEIERAQAAAGSAALAVLAPTLDL